MIDTFQAEKTQELIDLANLEELVAVFNQDRGSIRLLLLLSPT